MSDPLKYYSALVKAAQHANAAFAPIQHLTEQLARSSAFLTANRSGITDAVLAMQRQQELLQPTLGIQRVIDQMQAAQEMAERLAGTYGTSLAGIEEQANRWRQIIAPAIVRMREVEVLPRHFSGLADSAAAWESSASRLAQRLIEVGLVSHRPHLADRLFAPSHVFSDFARNTIARIEHEDNQRRVWALETSLELAEEQLITATDTLGAIAATPENEERVSESRELRSSYIQQDELLDAAENVPEKNTVALVDASPASIASDLSRSVLTAITTCNQTSKVAGKEEIFKPTTRLLEVYADMPWVLPLEKRSFADFVDCLYFLFYEGAGKDKLRFLKSQGGPIDDKDFDFVLCIKHLRNKWTRHDADHGRETAIRSAWEELAARFQWLGLHHMPVSADDYRLLHVSLLAKAYEFTEKILHGLVGK